MYKAGSSVDNAAQKGGILQNQRSLGLGNRSCPALTINVRLDFLLNTLEFLKFKTDVWQEVTPYYTN